MRSKAIFGLFAFAVVSIGLTVLVNQSAVAAKPEKIEHVPVTICHATGNAGKYVKMTVDDDSILNEQHVPFGNGHALHQDGRDIIPPFTTTDGFKFPGLNWDADGEATWKNGCVEPNTNPVFAYEITQRCGYIDVKLTKYPVFEGKPYYAVYTTNGSVVLPEQAQTFPATFAEDEGNGLVNVTWYIVGPEKDYLVGSDLPNYWAGVGETIAVDTDCEENTGDEADIVASAVCVIENGKSRFKITLVNNGEADGEATVNGQVVAVADGATETVTIDAGLVVKVEFDGEIILDETNESLRCEGGSGGNETPVTPSTPVKPASTIAVLPNTAGSMTSAIAVGALTILGTVLVAAGQIKSRLLAS